MLKSFNCFDLPIYDNSASLFVKIEYGLQRSEVLIATVVYITVLFDFLKCSLREICQHYGENFFLHFSDIKLN